MLKPGKKTKEWQKAKKRLIKEYREEGITRCEHCNGNFAMSFHHLDKRSSGKAKHTIEATRLLCANCHYLAEYDSKFNDDLRKMR